MACALHVSSSDLIPCSVHWQRVRVPVGALGLAVREPFNKSPFTGLRASSYLWAKNLLNFALNRVKVLCKEDNNRTSPHVHSEASAARRRRQKHNVGHTTAASRGRRLAGTTREAAHASQRDGHVRAAWARRRDRSTPTKRIAKSRRSLRQKRCACAPLLSAPFCLPNPTHGCSHHFP